MEALSRDTRSPEVRHRLQSLLQAPGLVKSPELLRRLRTILLLERIGTREAREVLQVLSTGDELALETQRAKLALSRMPHR